MSNNNNSNSGGIGFFGLLAIVFIALKLCKVINWSWWWITCPLWGQQICFLIYLPFKIREEKDKRNHLSAGYNEYGWNKGGRSKWEQRLKEMQEAKKKEENNG